MWLRIRTLSVYLYNEFPYESYTKAFLHSYVHEFTYKASIFMYFTYLLDVLYEKNMNNNNKVISVVTILLLYIFSEVNFFLQYGDIYCCNRGKEIYEVDKGRMG